jgi:hypothetical protein
MDFMAGSQAQEALLSHFAAGAINFETPKGLAIK